MFTKMSQHARTIAVEYHSAWKLHVPIHSLVVTLPYLKLSMIQLLVHGVGNFQIVADVVGLSPRGFCFLKMLSSIQWLCCYMQTLLGCFEFWVWDCMCHNCESGFELWHILGQ